MSYRNLPQALAAIDGAINEPPTRPWTDAYVPCARPGCTNLALRWLSPTCWLDGCGGDASWTKPAGDSRPPIALTADEEAVRDHLVEATRERQQLLADVREADELVPDSLDDQDRAALRRLTVQQIADIFGVPSTLLTAPALSEGPDAAEPVDVYDGQVGNILAVPALTPEQVAEIEERWRTRHAAAPHRVVVLSDTEPPRLAKPRPRPRPPWWRRATRWLGRHL